LSSYHNTGKSSIVPLYGYGLAAKGALAAALAILLQGRLQLAQAVTAVGVANVPAGATAAQVRLSMGCGALQGVGGAFLICRMDGWMDGWLPSAPAGPLALCALCAKLRTALWSSPYLSRAPSCVCCIVQNGLLLVPMGTLGNAVARVTSVGYLLLSLVLFILKDAAQRGRLGASTFKQLNIGEWLSMAVSEGWQAVAC
jgi:hypothetical protein